MLKKWAKVVRGKDQSSKSCGDTNRQKRRYFSGEMMANVTQNGTGPSEELFFSMVLGNPHFRAYIFYAMVLVYKMMFMSLLTIMLRMKTKSFLNPEDARFSRGEVRLNESVERMRRVYRAHRNDLENIPAFLFAAMGYAASGPWLWLFHLLCATFLVVRCLHTVVYGIYVAPQPTRVLFWGTGALITFYMCSSTISHIVVGTLRVLRNGP